jgi:hypothetical protein
MEDSIWGQPHIFQQHKQQHRQLAQGKMAIYFIAQRDIDA